MSKCELIELKDLGVNDTIELATSAARTNVSPVNPGQTSQFHVVRLVGGNVSIDASQREKGEIAKGHDLQPYNHSHLTWCDLCGEFIWGLYKQSLRCANCSYTCHYRCQPFIQLDCSTDGGVLTEQNEFCIDSIEQDTNVDEQVDWCKQEMTVSEVHHKVMEYNAQTDRHLYMLVNKDGSYTGFIKVHFQLVRPISLPPPQSLCHTQEEDQSGKQMRRRTSFYLPKDTVKHLHISSQTCVQEVIEALLNKFTVVDNPAKFALFERSERHSQVCMRKLSIDERPLFLRLCAGPSEKAWSLVLKENETGDVNWDAFSFPELCNFLQILKREEEVHVRQIVTRYALARDLMKQAMARTNTPV